MFKCASIHAGFYHHRKWLACLLLSLGGLSLAWLGCGKKGPPRPPKRLLPPVVKDLRHTIHGNIVELSWTLPDTAEGSAADPAAIKVLRAKQSGEDISCEGCPLRFVVAAEIPIIARASEESEPQTFQFSEIIDSGYRYFYKVTVFDEDGFGGTDSNIIKFDH